MQVRSLARDQRIFDLMKGYDLAMTDFAKKILEQQALTITQRHALEYRTRGQASNSLWHDFRWGRITASRFGAVVRRTKPAGPLVEALLYSKNPAQNVPSLKWGRDHEEKGRAGLCYEVRMEGCVSWTCRLRVWLHRMQPRWHRV